MLKRLFTHEPIDPPGDFQAQTCRRDRWNARLRLRRVGCPLALLAALCAWSASSGASALGAQAEHLKQLGQKYQAELERLAADAPGVLGVQVTDLTTGEKFGVNAELVFPQASAIKIPILLELYRQAATGRVSLSDRLPVDSSSMVGGTGVLNAFGNGTSQLSLRDLAVLMIVLSDNTATNLLIDKLGMESVNRLSVELGAPRTRLQRKMIRPLDSAAGRENVSTPAEAALLMARISRCDLPFSAEQCADLKRILGLSKSGALAQAVPAGVPIFWKPGGITGVATIWGLVDLPGRPYVIAAMMNYAHGDSAEEWIRRTAAITHDHFASLAGASPHGTRVPLHHLRTSSPQPPKP